MRHTRLTLLAAAMLALPLCTGAQDVNHEPTQVLTKDNISDFNKFYLPRRHNEGFRGGLEAMFRQDSQWSFYRSRQSEHFIVFWEPGFGNDPNGQHVDAKLRVDVDDLLKRAEEFYTVNVERLKMADVSQGLSRLNDYKIQIYLKYQTEWLATGAGYDNRVGALWVNPSTCQPVGGTIAHEIGHTFQYMVYCDHIKQGEQDRQRSGFRYGFGPDGAGGCGFWEQCAQWQAWQCYPREAFTRWHVDVWLANQHRHFCHEYMRYASYWLQYYWVQQHGITAVSRIWQESVFPEDPLETYTRIFCNGSLSRLYDELYDYAARMVTYDLDGVREYADAHARRYKTALLPAGSGYWQVAYASCPGTTGFNIIRLTPDKGRRKVSVRLEALTPGCALATGDAGQTVDADGRKVGTVTHYNTNKTTDAGYRYGFVSVSNSGKATYSPMSKGKKGTATWTVPEDTDQLFLVVMAAPDTYNRLPWDDKETTDEQWPYRFRVKGATVNVTNK